MKIRFRCFPELEPILATDDFPQEIHLRACLVLSRKATAQAAPASLAAQ